MKYWCVISCLLACLSMDVQGSAFRLRGVSGQEKDNIDVYLSNLKNIAEVSNKQIQAEVQEALQALGYYNPHITIEKNNNQPVIINIILGERVHIVSSDIIVEGEAHTDPAFIKLIENNKIKPGEALNQGDYDDFKTALSNLALERGYFDSEMVTHKLLIDPLLEKAYIRILFKSGPRYHFGATTIKGSQIELDKLYTLLPYQKGDPYTTSSVGLLNQRLAAAGWFSSVYAGANLDARKGDEVPVNVIVSPQKKNLMETGVGYTTNYGPRVIVKWKKPWINSAGDSLSFQTELSQYQPTAQLAYKVPLLNVLDDYYRFIAGVRYVDAHDTLSTDYDLVAERHWTIATDWNQILSVRWLYEDYKQGAFEEGIANLGLVGISYGHTNYSGGVMPANAQRSYVYLGYSDRWLGAKSSMFDIIARQGWIRTLSERNRVILRLEGGAVTANNLEDIPPALRFFIGGDNTVRGYRYQSIAPVDSKGELIGGQYMAIASLEYQYNVWGNWWAATFYDYGSSWYKTPNFVSGTGIGVRWASPIGSIRLDLAWGLDRPGTPYEIHFTLGPEL